jgi:hypothetical protein
MREFARTGHSCGTPPGRNEIGTVQRRQPRAVPKHHVERTRMMSTRETIARTRQDARAAAQLTNAPRRAAEV